MDAFGVEFGKTLGQLVGEYRTAFAWVAPNWHDSPLALLARIVRTGLKNSTRNDPGGDGVPDASGRRSARVRTEESVMHAQGDLQEGSAGRRPR